MAAGAGVVLAGLTSRSALTGALLVAAGLAIGLVPLRGLLPPGTLTARPGLPVAALSRALLTFAFFGADTLRAPGHHLGQGPEPRWWPASP